jgi:flagellar motor switch protein FliN/FliY
METKSLPQSAATLECGEPETGRSVSPAPAPAIPLALDLAVLNDVQVLLQAKLGHAEMTVERLMTLKSGAIVKLDAALADPIELWLNGAVIARGEIVAVGDHFGVRIVEIANPK